MGRNEHYQSLAELHRHSRLSKIKNKKSPFPFVVKKKIQHF